MFGFLHSQRWVSVVLVALLLGGCATKSARPLGTEQRQGLGRLGVATAHFAPSVVLEITRGKGDSAARAAANAALGTLEGGLQTRDGFGFLLSVLLAPVIAVGGAVYGAVAGDSAAEVHRLADPLDEVLYGRELQQLLKEALLQHTRRTAQPIARSDLRGSGAEGRWQDYRGEVDLDTVLEVGIREILLSDESVANTRVNLQVTGFARLVAVSDGGVVLEQDYLYRSIDRSLAEWSRNGGTRLRSELNAAFDQIAGRIADDYFLTLAELPPKLASLAATRPLPHFCFFCEAFLEPLPTATPEFCWEPFPAAADLVGAQGALLQGAEDVVYDLRVTGLVKPSETIRYDIAETCYRFTAPLTPCRVHWWQVRARFRVGERLYATPWVMDERNRFRPSCASSPD